MDNWTSGFRIDEAFHPWGTLFDVAAPGRVQSGYASVRLPCRSAYGFATVYAEPAAARPDRPVTTVTYELADTGTAPRYLFAELVKRLGPPDDISRDDSPEAAERELRRAACRQLEPRQGRGSACPSTARRGRPISAMALGQALSLLGRARCRRCALPGGLDRRQSGRGGSAAEGAQAQGLLRAVCHLRGRLPSRPSPAALALSTPDVLLTPPADRRAPRQDDFRPVERRRRFALVPLDRPHRPCCWVVRRHPRCTSTTSRRRAAAASRKSARHPGPFATPTVQPR